VALAPHLVATARPDRHRLLYQPGFGVRHHQVRLQKNRKTQILRGGK
jgi:hypothetical protein